MLPPDGSQRAQFVRRRRPAGEIGRLTAALAEARARIAELELMAEVDPLLNILNRRGFERALARALAYVKRYRAPAALLYLDLDGFKLINDAHGHAAGDAVLKAVAGILAHNVRGSDVVARLGGDEFAVLLFNLGEIQARRESKDLGKLPPGGKASPGPTRGFPSAPPWVSLRSSPMTSPRPSSRGPTVPCISARRNGGTINPSHRSEAGAQRRAG